MSVQVEQADGRTVPELAALGALGTAEGCGGGMPISASEKLC